MGQMEQEQADTVSPLGFNSKRPNKLSPLSNQEVTPKTTSKITVASMPWSSKKYSLQNSTANRTKKENALGVFPAQRRSLGMVGNSP